MQLTKDIKQNLFLNQLDDIKAGNKSVINVKKGSGRWRGLGMISGLGGSTAQVSGQ